MYTAAGETPSSAQMVLSGLNNLFSPVEHATLQLYKFVDKMTVSEHWDCVDIVDQSTKLKVSILTRGHQLQCVCTQGLALGNSFCRELFFIKKALAVLDFCHELTALQHAMRAEPLESECYVAPLGTVIDCFPLRGSPC